MRSTTDADLVTTRFVDEVRTTGPVSIVGHQTRFESSDASARTVSAPSGLISVDPDEMTVRVRAGTPVAELHAALAEQGQRTALPERGGTVGGALAVGENSTFLLRRGAVRDALLQARYVSAEGELVSAGGPTVKNVSGYNLARLLVGSWGRLGFLAECTLRTNPIPAAARWLRGDHVDPVAALGTVLNPAAVLWNGSATWVLLEGHSADVFAEQVALAQVGQFEATVLPPPLPAFRSTRAPSELLALTTEPIGHFVAAIGTGMAWTSRPVSPTPVDEQVKVIDARMKAQFDPTGRLNPGLKPGV